MHLRLGQQVTVQIGMPRRQHQNDRGALRLGVFDEGVKRLNLGLAHLVKAFHMYAVEAHAGFGSQRADLVFSLAAERYIVQNAAIRPLDGRGLVVGVALHRVKLDGVAFVVGDGGLAAVLEIIVHVALEVCRVGKGFPQLDLVRLFIVGGDVQDFCQKFIVQIGVSTGVKGGLAAVKDPGIQAPQ